MADRARQSMEVPDPPWYSSRAAELLKPLGSRWLHVQAVGSRAEQLASELCRAADREALIGSAWLHDIGYAPQLSRTGFHPLDGARYLRRLGVNERIAALVAHHTCSRYEAALRGLSVELGEFEREDGPVADALAYADMVTGPDGQQLDIEQRLSDIFRRYPPGSPVHEAISQASDELRAAVGRVEKRAWGESACMRKPADRGEIRHA